MTMGDQWSYKPDDRYKPPRQLVHLLVDVVAKGGNLLLNVGPDAEGRLPRAALERMREMGAWLRVNGEAIYGSRPVTPYRQGKIAFTRRAGVTSVVYAIYLAGDGEERLPERVAIPAVRPRRGAAVRLLGSPSSLRWTAAEGGGLVVEIPPRLAQVPPGRYAWTFRIPAAGE
jgi:alpha-L-fucosidase